MRFFSLKHSVITFRFLFKLLFQDEYMNFKFKYLKLLKFE